jgi:hypothetical protein
MKSRDNNKFDDRQYYRPYSAAHQKDVYSGSHTHYDDRHQNHPHYDERNQPHYDDRKHLHYDDGNPSFGRDMVDASKKTFNNLRESLRDYAHTPQRAYSNADRERSYDHPQSGNEYDQHRDYNRSHTAGNRPTRYDENYYDMDSKVYDDRMTRPKNYYNPYTDQSSKLMYESRYFRPMHDPRYLGDRRPFEDNSTKYDVFHSHPDASAMRRMMENYHDFMNRTFSDFYGSFDDVRRRKKSRDSYEDSKYNEKSNAKPQDLEGEPITLGDIEKIKDEQHKQQNQSQSGSSSSYYSPNKGNDNMDYDRADRAESHKPSNLEHQHDLNNVPHTADLTKNTDKSQEKEKKTSSSWLYPEGKP